MRTQRVRLSNRPLICSIPTVLPDTGKGCGNVGIEQGKSLKLHMYGHVRRSCVVANDESCFPENSCLFKDIERISSSPATHNRTN